MNITYEGGYMEASSQVPEAILKLVEKYDYHQAAYKRGQFNETQLRREFVDPFFKTLGWDVDNTGGYSELYKEVIHEDPIRIRGSTEFIDYAFRIGGQRKFIVETKKPAVNIKDDIGPALQIRRYAWNARLPLAILTDFEEFAVYDCTKKPKPGDTASTWRIAYFTYKDYPEKWEWIASIFAQESILKGSFDRFVKGAKGKKGTTTVDEAILDDIENWRDDLAKNIAIRNLELSHEEMNVAVQRTIDRILFLRICEDRGIEEYGCLQKLLEGEGVYERLLGLFHRADTRYNSGIFHFSEEPGWDEMPDRLTPTLIIDDSVLKRIIKRLYYPESPYEFSVISPVILGQVYEQFLGKVIRLTPGHQAKVEYKPEVKKAGGVYYTPEFIVDYIVNHTVGELVKDKTPRDVAKLRVLDPACGSGSFLLGAYQFLLDWHLNWYIHNLVPVLADHSATSKEVQGLLPEPMPRMGKKRSGGDTSLPIYKSTNGPSSGTRSDWKLTIAERKRILLNNIYGVDIDTQAVEVTKLSLLLKVLEEESEENVSRQLKLFEERALPSLHKNIKCGNSLIGTDIYVDVQATLDDPEAVKRINAFDWDREFPEIMQRGGFDAVIGNPPYVRQESLGLEFKEYAKNHYESYAGTADLYVYFLEKGHILLRINGYFGMICSNKFMRTNYGKNIRNYLSKKTKIIKIIDFGELPVFQNASTFPAIFLTRNCITNKQNFIYAPIKNLQFTSLEDEIENIGTVLDNQSLQDNIWTLVDTKFTLIIKKMNKIGIPLGDYINRELYFGIKTGLNKAFVITHEMKNILIEKDEKNIEFIKPFVIGDDIRKYRIVDRKRYLIFIPKGWTNSLSGNAPNKWRWFQDNFPSLTNYLSQFSVDGEKRGDKGDYWWELRACDYLAEFKKPKIILPDIAKESRMTFDSNGYYVGNTGYIIPRKDLYLLGILNSKLIFNYYKRIASVIGDPDKGGRLRWFRQDVFRIPIRTIDFSDTADKARHDKMVALVERMLALHRQKADVKTDHEKTLIERQIEATDRQIDTLVYELYELTKEEIGIVEGAWK